MLDTDTCIYLINDHPAMVPLAEPDDCAISVIVLGELQRGRLKTNRQRYKDKIDAFLSAMAVVALDAGVSVEYAAIRVHLEGKGRPIGPNDLWIAAHARSLNVPLVTNNTREFLQVPDLTVENWMGSGKDDK